MISRGIRELSKAAFRNALRACSDDTVTRIDYLRVFGRFPNLRNPQSFTEHLQSHKVYERDERLPALVDKVLVKRHVTRVLGPEWVTPTLWHGKRVNEALLRNIAKPSVLKANHSSGVIAFLDDDKANFEALARRANAWLGYDHHLLHREWAYGRVRRRLLIEPRIADRGLLTDYKFWVFGGKARMIQTDQARFTQHTRQFYDAAWKRLDVQMNYPAGRTEVPKPRHLDAMLAAAERLAEGFPFVRVDLYDCPAGPRFGEMTFWPEAGLCQFRPPSFDRWLGSFWPRGFEAEKQAIGLEDASFADMDQRWLNGDQNP